MLHYGKGLVKPVKAVILVGGEGTRLRPLTCNIPKALVPVLNQPFIEHLLIYLKKHGIREVILAMSYHPDAIERYLGDGTQLGIHLNYLVEESPLGTAGAVKNAEPFLDETFVVFNGDIVTDIDITAVVKRHREVKPGATIALTPVDNPTIYGVVETDDYGMVKRFLEKPTWDNVTTNMINAGIYILEPAVLKQIPPSTRCSFEHDTFPQLLDMGERILGYGTDTYWIDIGSPEKYLKVHHDLLRRWGNKDIRTVGESRIHHTAQLEGPLLIAEGCTIGAGARLKGPGVLGPGCDIGGDAIIEGSVLWGGARVNARAVLKDCVIGSGSCVEEDCHLLEGSVLGEEVTIARGGKLPPGTLIWPDN